MTHRSFFRTAAVAAALIVAGCFGDSTGLHHRGTGRLSLAPVFQTKAALVVAFTKVRITLDRANGTALDTTVDFPPGADSLVLALQVAINGTSETLSLNLAMIDAAGDTVFRGGPSPVTVSLGVSGTAPPVPVTIRYVGVGSNARSVRIGTRAAALVFRDSIQLTATALDSAGNPIPGTPIAWRSLDSLVARVPDNTAGKVIAGLARGVARIQAMLLTNQADTALVTVQPVPAAIGVLTGGGQSGAVGAPLAQPLVVRVKAADSLGVQGVVVNFAVATGGGSLSKLADTTNASGDATTIWTLGGATGAQSVTASVKVAPSLTATLPATGVAGSPKGLVFQVQPSTVLAGVAMAPAVQVVAQDSFANTATTFTGNVTLAIGTNPGSATLGGTVTVAAVAGVASFSTLTLDKGGTGYTLAASATGLAGATSAAFNVTGGTPTQLTFTQQPTNAVAGAAIAPAVTIAIRDVNGNVVGSATNAVTLAIGNNAGGGTLSGTTTVNAVAGIATFADLSIDKVGAGYTLAASATGLTGATSSAFTIAAGAARQLAFTTQPGNTSAGTGFGVAVTARDSVGNTATSFTGNVTVAITGGTGKSGAALRGTTTAAAVGGVATFAGLSVDSVGAGYSLTATATGPASATSATFNVTAAPANRLVFTTQPANTTAGAVFGVVVTARDSVGNTASGFTGNVAVAITGGTGKAGAALRGTATVAAAAGVATFSGLSIDSAGAGYTLTASATGPTSASSTAFTVAAAPANRLTFTAQPANTTAGATFAVVATARDSVGNTASSFTGNVAVAITGGTGKAGASLRGTTTVAAVGGVATFGGLSVDSVGNAYTLTATATGVTGATSTAFNIAPAPANRLVFTTQPANTTAGVGFGVVVAARDSLGNTATGFTGNVAVAITGGTGTAGAALRGTATVTAVAGVATFSGLSIDSVGTGYTLTATAAGASSATSLAFNIALAPASKLTFTTEPPASSTAGTGFGVVVTARDSLGNAATGFTGNVLVAITGGTGKAGATLRGTTTVAAVAGVATFSGLSVDSVGAGYTLTATSAGLTSGTSSSFAITASPASRLAITAQPANTAAGAAFGFAVTARDSLGNTAPSFTGNVTAAITGGTGTAGAALRGTKTVAAVAGVATFSGLSIDSVGTGFTLTASAAGPTSATSATFNVTAAPATQLAFTTQPTNTTAGAAFGVVVTARDSLGNTATGFAGSVAVAISAGTGKAGAALRGTKTLAAVAGVATFNGLSIDSVGAGYTLTASATGPTSATSTAFNVAAAPAAQLAFTTQPANTTAGTAFGVVATARDSLGNTSTAFVGNVTVAITGGTGTAGAALRGTKTVAAVAGVATFSGLSIDSAGGGYTVTASSAGVTSGVSTSFRIDAAPAVQLAFTTQPPPSTTAAAGFGVVVTARDSLGNTASAFTGSVAAAITGGTGKAGAALRGTTTLAAVAGVATFSGLSIDSVGSNYTLTATATGVTSATSTAITVGAGAAASLAFTVQPPASSLALAPFGFTVTAKDAGGNVATGFTGAVTVAIGTNPAGGTPSGTLTQNAVSGVATFSGVSIDNIGAGYTLVASATGPSPATSAAFAITAALNVNAWINSGGGNWSLPSNWSKGTVPVATDTVAIKQSGTYTVNLDVNGTFARLDAGAPSGTQTLSVAANTLTAGNGSFATNAVLNLSGTGTIAGPGTLTLAGTFNWTGGNLGGGSGTIQVLAGGTASIAPAANVQIQTYTLEVDGTGTWTGTAFINSGSAGTLRVGTTGVLTVSGDPTFSYNLGGTASLFDNRGTVNRTTSLNSFVMNVPVSGAGSWNVQSGSLNLQYGGTVSGPVAVASVATLNLFTNPALLTFDGTSSVTGSGTMNAGGGTATFAGTYNVTGSTQISGGTVNFNTASGSTGSLTASSGTLAGTGLLQVSGAMSWTGGNLGVTSGAAGTTRVLSSGTLSLAPAATMSFQNYNLEVAGTGTWTGTQTVQSGSGAVLRVLGGGTLTVSGDPTFTYNLGGAASQLTVYGTLNRTTSANPAVVSAAFNDSGTVSVQSGTLRLANGGTSSGAFAVSTGATLDFNGGTHSLAAASGVSGAGTVSFSGGTATLGGSYAETGATLVSGGTANFNTASGSTGSLTVSSGTLAGTGLLQVSGAMSWTGGSLGVTSGAAGTTRVLSSGTLSLAPAATVSFQNYNLEVAGTGTWTGTQTVQSGSGAILRVATGGVLDIQGDPTFTYNLGGAASQLTVYGTLNRTTSANPAVVSAAFNDSGTVSVQSGTLRLANGGTSSGAFAVSTGATLDFNGGTHSLAAASGVSGAGTVSFSGGTATLGGSYAETGATLVSGGTANFNGVSPAVTSLTVSGGTLAGTGLLQVSGAMSWTGGSLGVTSGAAGTTRVLSSGTLSLAPAATVSFQNYNLEVAGTGTWTGTQTVQSGSGAVLRVLGGGTLTVSGDPTFTYNLGGASTLLENLGTITRTTSSGIVTVAAPFNLAGPVNINSGIVSVAGGGTMSGTVTLSGPSLLQFASSVTLANNFQVRGSTGITQVLNGATLGGLAPTDTAFFSNLQLVGGALSLSGGTIKDSASTIWTGNVSLNGGTLFNPVGGALSLGITSTASLQNATILNAGAAVFTTAGTLNSGSGAVIRNLSGATFAFSAPGSFLYNLGGTASLFDNQGTLTAAPATGAVVISAPISNSGTLQVAVDTLRLTGGSTGTFPGTVSVTSGAVLEFGGGTFTQGSALTVGGNLLVSAGGAVPNGHPVSVAGNFATSGAGTITMASPLDSLLVAGNASFAGGAGALSAGGITVGGNFSQSNAGGSATSFASTGTNVVLTGSAASQSVSFTNPTTSFFRRLQINKSAGAVALGSNVRASFFRVASATAVTGPAARLFTDSVYTSVIGSSITPLAVEITSVFADTGGSGFSPDTTVFTGANQSIPLYDAPFYQPLAYKSIRVAQASGTATLAGNLGLPNDLVVSSGTLSTNNFHIRVTGNFRTEATGVLQMTLANDSLGVGGSATFSGGASAPSAGLISVAGDFSQTTNATAFAPTGTHQTFLGGAGAQNISFANPTTSFFRRLAIPAVTHNVVLQTNAQVTDSLTMFAGGGAATMLGAGTTQRLTVGGVVTLQSSTATPRLTPPVLELSTTPNILASLAGSLSPDTTVFLDTISALPTGPGIAYKSVRVNTTGAFTTPGQVNYNGNLIISAGMYTFPQPCCNATDSVRGFLRTEGTGTLQLKSNDGIYTLVVRDSAVFAGGDETGLLSGGGTLRIGGNFVQRVGTGGSTTFQADPFHTTVFEGSGTQTVTFESPGANLSRFGNLQMAHVTPTLQPAGITLGSNIFLSGYVNDTSNIVADSIAGQGFTVTAASLSLPSNRFVMNNAPLVTNTGLSGFLSVSGLTFRNMDPTVTQWTMDNLQGTSIAFSGVNFQTVPTTGLYFAAIAGAVSSPVMSVSSSTPVAAGLAGFYTRTTGLSPVIISWNGVSLP